MGDHETQALGVRGSIGGYLQAVGATRAAGDQHPVEPGMLVGAGVVTDERQVEVRCAYATGLGPLAGEDHADKFNGHG
ncbi:hypothetical protein D3C76_1500390 [compost metagenome]